MARLRLTTGDNRVLAGQGYDISKTFIVVNAVNVSNRATTIQVIGMYTYDNWWKRFRRRATKAFVINVASPGNIVPYVLEPGHSFMGPGAQTDELVRMSREKLLFVCVAHSMGKRDMLIRLKPIEVKTALNPE